MEKYPPAIGQKMKEFYQTLSEKDRRRYAAIEALKLGHGGIIYISKVLGCSRNTVGNGMEEMEGQEIEIISNDWVRRPGGGRKSYERNIKDTDEKFLNILRDYTAGNPMDETVRRTNLTQKEISGLLLEKYDIRVSSTVISKLLKKHSYKRRKSQKKQTIKDVGNRNGQFENIIRLGSEYENEGCPVISIDTKKKSL